MQSILIIQTGALGDSVLTLFLADALKYLYPEAVITLAGHKGYCLFMPGRTVVDRIVDLDSLPLHLFFLPMLGDEQQDGRTPEGGADLGGHDLIVSFLYDESGIFRANILARNPGAVYCQLQLRPDKGFVGHVTSYWLGELAGQIPEVVDLESRYLKCNLPKLTTGQISTVSGRPLVTQAMSDPVVAEKLLDKCGVELLGRKLVVIHPGSGGVNKTAPLEWFLNLARRLGELDTKPVFITGPVENERNPQMRRKIQDSYCLLPELDSEVLAILLCRADCYFGNDSGPSHLAGACGTPTVTIFGPTSPQQWRPVGEKNSVINFGKVYNP